MAIDDEEKDKKHDRIRRKLDNLLEEVAEDMLDQEARDKIEEQMKDMFAKASIPFTIMSLKAAYEGISLGAAAMNSGDGSVLMPLIAWMKYTIKKKERELSNKADQAMGGASQNGDAKI